MTVYYCVTQAVIEEIIKTERVPVRVNGPIGGENILAQGYDHLLMIAGGIAVSMRNCFLPCSALFCPVLPCSALFCPILPCSAFLALPVPTAPSFSQPPQAFSHTP